MNCNGLMFFPHETKLCDGIKIIQSRFGILGYGVIFKLYERIYSEGYYCRWDEKICRVFAFDECRLKADVVASVVESALDEGIFDKAIFEKYAILTSREIQEKFWHVAKNRKGSVIEESIRLISCDGSAPACPLPEKKSEKNNIFYMFEIAVRTNRVSEFIAGSELAGWLDFMDCDLIVEAFKICISKNKRNVDYLKGILGNFKERGIVYASELRKECGKLPRNIENSTFRNYPEGASMGEIEKNIIKKMMSEKAGKG